MYGEDPNFVAMVFIVGFIILLVYWAAEYIHKRGE
tara:strand:+ start:208 stop:312 length:105 start_codon:yes stop_codon:yes gene_type:complete